MWLDSWDLGDYVLQQHDSSPLSEPRPAKRLRPYVVATGSIAAGATTLATTLIDNLGWSGHLEGAIENDNAFFGDAYQNFERWGFHSQVHFLVASANRHAALENALCSPSEHSPAVVEDRTPFEHTGAYLVAYDRLKRISDREVALLRQLTRVIESSYLTPDLLIFRQMTTEQLGRRVASRGRAGESAADLQLLEALRVAFEDFVADWDRSAKLILPPDVDLLEPGVAADVAEQVARTLNWERPTDKGSPRH